MFFHSLFIEQTIYIIQSQQEHDEKDANTAPSILIVNPVWTSWYCTVDELVCG